MLLLIIISIILFLFIRWRFFGVMRLLSYYNKYGVVTVGKRGKGKDVSFSVFAHNRLHYSNIPYNRFTEIRSLTDLRVGVSPVDLINENFSVTEKKLCDGVPFLVSDGGVYFASWLDNELKKRYPSVPVTMALYRHLYNTSMHINTQCFSRLWLLIREQAEAIIQCRSVLNLSFKKHGYLLCTCRYYENFQDCENGLKPLKKPLLFGKSTVNVENSRRGDIKDFRYLVPVKWLEYDSRIFHSKIFGFKPLSSKENKKILKAKKSPLS